MHAYVKLRTAMKFVNELIIKPRCLTNMLKEYLIQTVE